MYHLHNFQKEEELPYKIEIVEPNDEDEIIELLSEHYFVDNPILQCVKNKPCEFMINRTKSIINEGVSCKAVHIQSGKIIGVALNRIVTNENIKVDYNECENPHLKIALQFVEHFKLEKFPIFQAFPLCTKILDTEIISVAKKWRRWRVATKLIEETLAIGRRNNIYVYQCICSNVHFGTVCARIGYRPMYISQYKSYCVNDETPIIPESPHEFITYFVKTI